MGRKAIDLDNYYRRDVFKHFSKGCKCSTSITSKVDVTCLVAYSKKTSTKFYLNFLYALSRGLNSIPDLKMFFEYQTGSLYQYDSINPIQYVFHEETKTFTIIYSYYYEDYDKFYKEALKDLEEGKKRRDYGFDLQDHPNWFDASYIPWLNYSSLNIEMPDGYLYFAPTINWGKYVKEDDRIMMPLTIRLNHAIGDGYHISAAFLEVQDAINRFCD